MLSKHQLILKAQSNINISLLVGNLRRMPSRWREGLNRGLHDAFPIYLLTPKGKLQDVRE